MKQIVKSARAVGTSAGILLPRAWLNKEVVVILKDLTEEDIARNVFNLLLEKRLLKETKGIYLIGSYARGDNDTNSDIDILVITKKINKLIKLQNYEITLISENSFAKKMEENLYRILSVREAKSILNEELIEKYKKVKPKLKLKKLKDEIKSILSIHREVVLDCKSDGKNIPDSIIYSLVLRSRETYLIDCLIKNRVPSKKEFQDKIKKPVYESYLRIKREEKERNTTPPELALEIIEKLEKWLKG